MEKPRMTRAEKSILYQQNKQIDLDLWQKYHDDENIEARNTLVMRQEHSVNFIVNKHLSWKNGCDRKDLVQEGFLGIIKAVEKFNPKYKVPFNYFACRWIEASIRGAIWSTGRTVKPSVNLSRRYKKMNDMYNHLEEQNGTPPSDEVLIDHLPNETMKSLSKLRYKGKISVNSLDACISSNTENSFMNLMPSKAKDPYYRLEHKNNSEMLKSLKKNGLTEREASVIDMRFPKNKKPLSQERTANKLGVTKMCVCAIEKRAIKKLRHEYLKQGK